MVCSKYLPSWDDNMRFTCLGVFVKIFSQSGLGIYAASKTVRLILWGQQAADPESDSRPCGIVRGDQTGF